MAVHTIERLTPRETKRRLDSGELLLVNACTDPGRFSLEGSLRLEQFQAQLYRLPLDQEIVFYCT